MTKHLVRGGNVPSDSEEISTSEFFEIAFEQIACTALSARAYNETEQVLNAASDILELLGEILNEKNIQSEYFFEHAAELRNTQGAFNKKVAVNKD